MRDVGDHIVVVHGPLRPVSARLHHAEQSLRFVHIAVERSIARDVAAGEFVEEADLAKIGPMPAIWKNTHSIAS